MVALHTGDKEVLPANSYALTWRIVRHNEITFMYNTFLLFDGKVNKLLWEYGQRENIDIFFNNI